ncbi:hypothetical protein BpHYR1_007601 [Brachionus plicatilis]|uniref:Uncharacterized protein n=1 Tax=Brachionus plicatilis TaxID=10195 RepID=A0A3M7R184_BRAPC|nr:hypothetical protein BpHYR1_007601 [Brachionus plicatilis]
MLLRYMVLSQTQKSLKKHQKIIYQILLYFNLCDTLIQVLTVIILDHQPEYKDQIVWQIEARLVLRDLTLTLT